MYTSRQGNREAGSINFAAFSPKNSFAPRPKKGAGPAANEKGARREKRVAPFNRSLFVSHCFIFFRNARWLNLMVARLSLSLCLSRLFVSLAQKSNRWRSGDEPVALGSETTPTWMGKI